VPPGGLAGETDLHLARAIHLNELEQLPPNVHLSGGVGMLFRETQLNRGRAPLAQPSAAAEGEEQPQEDGPDDAAEERALALAAAAAKSKAEQARAAQDAL
jgi:hypothetical protein